MEYDVYPCDFTPDGECPKRCKDCANCWGWNYENYADEPEGLAELLKPVE